jgi:hypothetical protein
MQVWLNGARVQDGILSGTASKPDKTDGSPEFGANNLLLKVHHGSGAGGFYFGLPQSPVLSYHSHVSPLLWPIRNKRIIHQQRLSINKPETGWSPAEANEQSRSVHHAIFVAKTPILFAGGAVLKLRLTCGPNFGRFRIRRH